ncbi:MAG: type IV toxin-antitoxin system AbiEi family antitoxin [Candidatus Rokuibacteriota bacterium]
MLRVNEIKKHVAHRLRELFPRAQDWQELIDSHVGEQTVDVLVRFRIGSEAKTLICEVRPLGQPRHVREALTRLRGLRERISGAYPVVAAPYISPQSALVVRQNGCGYLDLSGNCYIAFDNVQIEKEGKPNARPTNRPLKALFAPRATRIVRALLVERDRSWRLEELGRAVAVSLGHVHNVVKRLEDLEWIERASQGRVRVQKPGDLLDAWREAYTYRANAVAAFVAPVGEKQRIMEGLARQATALGLPYAFTLHAGASLIGPQIRVATVHCYVGGDAEPLARALGLQPVEGEGAVYLMTPYDQGVFYAPLAKGGLRVACLPQLYVDLYGYERRGREQAEKLRRDALGY